MSTFARRAAASSASGSSTISRLTREVTPLAGPLDGALLLRDAPGVMGCKTKVDKKTSFIGVWAREAVVPPGVVACDRSAIGIGKVCEPEDANSDTGVAASAVPLASDSPTAVV